MTIAAAVRLCEAREGLRDEHRTEEDLREELAETSRRWGSAFERTMPLGGDDAVEAGPELNAVPAEIDWQATGRVGGTLEERRGRHRAAFRAIDVFHEEARADLGIRGGVGGENHPERDPLVLPVRRPSAGS